MVFLVVGDANADLFAALDRFPHEGDDSPLRDLGWGSGGSAANVATALGRLGARVRLLARVGVDPAAEIALRAAREAGVELLLVQRDPSLSTGLCFAAVSPGGERTFFSFRGANTAQAPPDLAAAFAEASWLHVAGHALLEGRQRETALALLDEARRRSIPASLDLCLPLLRAARQQVLELAPRLEIVFANEPELGALAASPDEAISLLEQLGVPLVAAKLGARGSRLGGRALGGRARCDVAPFAIDARDSTGAGDAYVAGLLLAHVRGAAPELAARAGNALGALAASRSGAADALPRLAEVHDFLAARGALRELDAISAHRGEGDPRS